MTASRIASWLLAGILFVVPLYWLGRWGVGSLPPSISTASVIAGIWVSWGIGGGLVYWLITDSMRRLRKQEDVDEQAMKILLAQPLVRVEPKRATLRLGEYAYGALEGKLQKIQPAGAKESGRLTKTRTVNLPDRTIEKTIDVAAGELVITDQRVMFTGDHESFFIALENLATVTNYRDGFAFEDAKSSYTIVTGAGTDRATFALSLHKITNR